MSKLKHTPGPWLHNDENDGKEKIISQKQNKKSPYDSDVISTGYDGSLIISKANAKLIATAPEMLDFLIFAYECYIDISFFLYSRYELKKLIEKATGMKIEEVLKDE
jgi:hypothetical protein